MLDDAGKDALFRLARTHNRFSARPVPPALLRELHELTALGPTSANCSPQRVIFVVSAEAKARLMHAMSPGNVAKVASAPVTAVLAWDSRFYEHGPRLFPHNPSAHEAFARDPAQAHTTAFRNASLQAGYFILAARALGLDCGPLSGFQETLVNTTFFPEGRYQVNFLCNLGYGDASGLFGRLPRFDFNEVCDVL